MEENMVKISTEEYAKLQTSKAYLTILRDALLNDSDLNYSGESFTHSDSAINGILRTMFPVEYTARLATLKKREEEA